MNAEKDRAGLGLLDVHRVDVNVLELQTPAGTFTLARNRDGTVWAEGGWPELLKAFAPGDLWDLLHAALTLGRHGYALALEETPRGSHQYTLVSAWDASSWFKNPGAWRRRDLENALRRLENVKRADLEQGLAECDKEKS